MNRDKIATRFGWNVLQALEEWKNQGYDLKAQSGSLILTAEKTEIRIERWSSHIYVRMASPVIKSEGTWAGYINTSGDCPASVRVVKCVEDYLKIAERERYRLTPAQRATFSREWNSLFDSLGSKGYRVEWVNGLGGYLQISCANVRVDMQLGCGTWYIHVAARKPYKDWTDYQSNDTTAIAVLEGLLREAEDWVYGQGGGAA